MSDDSINPENHPETQIESDGDGSGRPPRKTAIGAPGYGPKPWVGPSEAKDSNPVPYASIFEALQVEDTANFEIMSRAHAYLVHRLDTSFFIPDSRKLRQQALLNELWNGWSRSSGRARASTTEIDFAKRSLDGLNHYQVLQVLPSAPSGVVKTAYEYLERVYHPDNPATRDSEKYETVREAWRVLSDQVHKEVYDRSLLAEVE